MTDEANRPSPDDATLAFSAQQPKPALEIPGYRVLRALGEGGMGTVYLAEDESLGRRVAIKVISHGVSRDPAIRARFLREARLLATIEHPNVVRVYSFGASEERAYLVMEYVEGETLADRIRRGPIALAEAREIAAKVVDALDAAWEKKIVHRDIKPSNILFDRRGDLKVADFGLAKGIEGEPTTDSSLTQTGYLLGSPHYVAPEQAQGREADFRADIYSLGVTLFEMLTGKKPFEGNSALAIIARHLHDDLPSITSFRRDVGSDLADLVVWMTEKDPESRPKSYGELREAVNALDPADPTIITKKRRSTLPLAARRLPLALSAICLVATLVLFVFFQVRGAQVAGNTKDNRLVIAIAPFWGPDDDSIKEGRSMAALIQQQIVNRIGSGARVIGIDETKAAVRDTDSARELGERLGATAVIWGQAFALHNEREIQPSLTLVPRKNDAVSTITTALTGMAEMRLNDLPNTPAIRVQSQAANQIELRKTSAEGIGDLVTFVAAMHALSLNDAHRALELLSQARRTPDALYQKAVCLAQMQRDDDAARELNEALKLDPAHAPSLALLADIDARALRFAEAAGRLRAAAATGRPFTTSDAALYNDKLYVKERYRSPKNALEETATLLAVDPAAGRVLDRWELPGPVRFFSVEDSGITMKYDIGPPRNGELATLHFVNDRFLGPPLPHVTMLGRIKRQRPGWYYAQNFMRELGFPGLKLKLAHFAYSPIDADPALPSTFPDLKATLEKAIARDPTQPWYRFYLALTTRELGDPAGANRIMNEMFALPNRGTAYYEFSWMARQLEPLGHHEWADRAYAEALKRRKAEPEAMTATATVERMVDSAFVRAAAYHSRADPNPARDHLWLVRAREITGLSWDGDETAAAAWARYLRAHGDVQGANAEEAVRARAHELFGGKSMALALNDLTRAAQIAIVIAIAVLLAIGYRRGGTARKALAVLALLLVVTAAVRIVAASRVRLVESIPVPLADDLGHPVIVATLDEILTRRDSAELRFVAAVAHHLAGHSQRAGELYRSVEWEIAGENARNLDSAPPNAPTQEIIHRAFFESCPYELWATVKAAWGPRPSSISFYPVAYDASRVFYLSLLLALAVLLFVAANPNRSFSALPVTLFVAGVVFAATAFLAHRTATARVSVPVSGKYSGQWLEPHLAYPFPPDPTAEKAMLRAVAHSEPMRLFWIALALGALAGVGGGVVLGRAAASRWRQAPRSAPRSAAPGETAADR